METIQKLKENAAIFLPENGLKEKINLAEKENRKLIIKLGFDPTAPDLHLGHAVVLKKLKQFQDLGHQIVIVVGSFTARIGDPTGKSKSRKPLSAEEVKHNAETYISQLSKIIDVEKTKIVFNSEWLDKLSFSEIIQIMSNVTVAQLMHRNDFNKRFSENTPIAMHELVYPILQGFDSVKINADIEMGGTDQLFNCTMGRQLQENFNIPGQIVMCMPLLKGLDGKEKMSKSLHNTIGLIDEPNEMFGKTMSIPDALILEFLELTTDFSLEEKQEIKSKIARTYYLLGSHYNYSAKKYAISIAYYEKALQLNPNDPEIQTNLDFARKMAIDDIKIIPKVGFDKLIADFTSCYRYDTWAWIAVVFGFVFLAFFIGYYFSPTAFKKRMYFSGMFVVLIVIIISVSSGMFEKNRLATERPAIVFAETASVKGEPKASSPETILLHEGTKVYILESIANWKKVQLTDETTGWISDEAIKELN